MSLKEFFEDQKDNKPSENQKMKIYENFLNKKTNRKSIFSRVSFYQKVAVYSVFIIFLMYSFYIPTNFQSKEKTNTKDTKITKSQNKPSKKIQNTKIAKANYVGKIIKAKGDIQLFENGKEYDSEMIGDGDEVKLGKNSEVKFQVNSGIISKIKGPAKFNIQYIGQTNNTKKYAINLKSGDYLKVQSQNNNKEKNKDNKSENDNVVVRTQDFEVEPQQNKNINFEITSKDKKKYVKNNGSNVVIEKSNKKGKTYTSIDKDEKAQIGKQVRKIAKKIEEKDFKSDHQINTSGDDKQNIDSLDLDTPEKNSLSKKQLNKLDKLLYSSFIEKDIKNIVITYFKGNKESAYIAYHNYLSRINKVYKLLNLDFDSKLIKYNNQNKKDLNPEKLSTITDQLIGKIENNYYLPKQKLKRLNIALSWIVIMNKKEFGKFSKKQNLTISHIIDEFGLNRYKENLNIK